MHPHINTDELHALMTRVEKLTVAEQVYLIELIGSNLRRNHLTDEAAMEASLDALVNSPLMQGKEIPYPVPDEYAAR